MLNVLGAKILVTFQKDKLCDKIVIDRQNKEMQMPLWRLNQMVAKDDCIGCTFQLWDGFSNAMLALNLQSFKKERAKLAHFSTFLGAFFDCNVGFQKKKGLGFLQRCGPAETLPRVTMTPQSDDGWKVLSLEFYGNLQKEQD